MKPTWRTPARRALLLAEYATATDSAGFLARVEALPGPTGGTIHGLRVWARALGLRKTPEALAAIMRVTQVKGGRAIQAQLAGRPAGRRYVPTPERIALLRERRAARAAAKPVKDPLPRVWTPERDALVIARYPLEGVAALLDDLRALPGLPIPGVESIRRRVKKLGLRMDTDGRRRVRKDAAAAARAALPPKPRPEPKPKAEPKPRPEPKPRRQPHAREIVAATDMSVARRAFVTVAPLPDVDLTPEQQAERADAAIARRHERARVMLAKRGACPHAVAKAAGLPLREAFRIAGEMRMGGLAR